MELTQKRLKDILNYDPLTGQFIWRITINSRAKAGSRAGRIDDKGNCHTNGKKQYLKKLKPSRRSIRIDGKDYSEHRLAWLYIYGEFPQTQLDHINQDACDNRIHNLREVTHSTNQMNRGEQRNNTTGFKGVYISGNKYQAQIVKNGKCYYLGTFVTAKAASDAYQEKARQLFGEYAPA